MVAERRFIAPPTGTEQSHYIFKRVATSRQFLESRRKNQKYGDAGDAVFLILAATFKKLPRSGDALEDVVRLLGSGWRRDEASFSDHRFLPLAGSSDRKSV